MSELAAIEAHQAALAEIAHLNKQIDMLVEQVNSMVNQLDRAEYEVKGLKEGFVQGIYMSACYCTENHVCTPCSFKKKFANEKLLADCKVMAEVVLVEHEPKYASYDDYCTCDACTVARRCCGN